MGEIIKPVKNNKPPDPRGVAPEFFKYGSEKLFRVNTSEMVRTAINGKHCKGIDRGLCYVSIKER